MQRTLRLTGLVVGGLACLGLALDARGSEPGAARHSRGAAAARPSGAALRFEPNRGQFEDRIRYLARGPNFGLHLSREGATLALKGAESDERAIVGLRVVGARAVEPQGFGVLPGHSNYVMGNAAQHWVNAVASFSQVQYAGVLPGVDLVFYGTGARELEYDLRLAPGADPALIELELDGVVDIELSQTGDALLKLPGGGELKQHRPIAYQLEPDGVRHFLPAEFRVLPGRRLGFRVSGVDPARALVIDPVLSYATYLGGSRYDHFNAVAADASGNTYAVGYTTGTLFPTAAAAQPGYGGGFSDAVIVKLNAAGNSFIYATYLGGSDADQAYGVAVDASGNAYVTGVTFSANFPKLGALQPTLGGGQDAFVAKLNGGGALVYSTFLGGTGDDLGQAIAVNAAGEAYVAGSTFSANFPKLGAFQGALSGTNDAFVSRLTAAGSSLVSSTYLGGAGGEYGQGIAIDNAGGAIVVGQTGSSNFPVLSAAQGSFGGSLADAFISRFNPAGSSLVYSTYLGGSASDVATGVAQVGGAAIVAGYTSSSNFPVLGGGQAALGGGSDAFLTRVNQSGSAFDYSTFLGGASSDAANAVLLDGSGFVYVVGETASTDFPAASPITGQEVLKGTSDAFLAAFSSSSGAKSYASYLGGNAADSAVGVAAGAGLLHVLGNTFSSNFPTQSAIFSSPLGPQDGFVARLPVQTLAPAPAGGWMTWCLLGALLLGSGLFALGWRRPSPTAGPTPV